MACHFVVKTDFLAATGFIWAKSLILFYTLP